MANFSEERKLEMYRFFLVAFDAAPGVTYLQQLREAVEAGLSTKDIVNVFTTKQQFTNRYPSTLSSREFATSLVEQVVGSSATASAKSLAIDDIVKALDAGLSRRIVTGKQIGRAHV